MLELREEIERLVNEGCAPQLATLHPKPAVEAVRIRFDRAARETLRALDLCEYTVALTALEATGELLSELRRATAAQERCDAAKMAWSRLVEGLELAGFLALPCLRIPERLLARAEAQLASGQFLKAGFTSGLARESIERMEAQSTNPQPGLMERVDRLYDETRRRGLAADLLDLWNRVRQLAAQGRHRLARNLADDLEIEHLGWRAERAHTRAASAGLEDLASELSRLETHAKSAEARLERWILHA